MAATPRNDRLDPVTKFCLAMEEFRRTDAGRVRNAKELLAHFFPHDDASATDQLFFHMPREVRAPVVSAWGIRGAKAALRDDDKKVRAVVHDALLAGDIDAATFEEGVTASTLVDWIPLQDWWKFWRTGKVSGFPVQKALATARELGLFDDRWFLQNVEARGGRLKGTDTLCDTLSKEQIVAWMRGVHASGDGSPSGLISALGWETVLIKTSEEALLFALDAFAKKVGLVAAPAQAPITEHPTTDDGPASDLPPVIESMPPIEDFGPPVVDSKWPEAATPGDMGFALKRKGERDELDTGRGATSKS